MTRRVAVIGGGSSGLACIKCCLDEGLEPVCYESSDDIGGLWKFKENPEPDRASIYHSVIINTSKEMMCFSDFPIPAHFPNYMHNSLIMDYFRMFADHFQLTKHIRFNTKVLQVRQRSDFSHSGQWDVETENKHGKTEKHIFDAVMICIGHHCHPNLPLHDFQGIDTFKGTHFHSRDYKTPEEWRNKKAVVIGIGNSGGDIAVELSRVTKQVKPNIRRFQGSSVEFEEGSVVEDVDLVVFATGYRFSFPFLASHVTSVSGNKASLYNMKVAVIGAGVSGLTSIKACLDEGLQPTCFESSHDIGGLWRFKEKPEPGRANIYQSVVINSSKEKMAFSDFPPPADLPNNMHHSEVLQYIRLYAQAFNLLQNIHFKTSVLSVRQTPDFAATGRWEVETERTEGPRETHVFDAVIVCTGHFSHPHLPLSDFPGIESFEGRYFHSWDYCNAEGLQGKRVVVIGIGNSGGDIAVDISRVAEKVYLSTRSGAWVVGRVGQGGLPGDIVGTSRLDMMIQELFPSWVSRMVEKKLDEAYDHKLYGRVQVKPNVKEFCGSSVVFVDGSIDEVDVVVFATGYNYSFPFLPSALQAKSGYRLRLYKHVFPPALSQPTLAVVGFINGLGSITPLSEMQARWATRVFKGLSALPSEEAMNKEIEKDTETMHQSFACSERNPLQVDYIPYLDSVAEQVGVRPNILWLMLKDPRLALQVLLGPCTPYQYRLSGPGQWDGARDAILTQWERVLQPFRTRVVLEPETRPSSRRSAIVILSGAALLYCFLYRKHLTSSFFSSPLFFRSLK
ncbi:Dimethylaniline monooxygenase [N-oxide-forming] 5 [Dissostichus eleginoides]|uniref:Flavin-containing monooxygenase n=1 Tax=Dissostichus eleginoides TaxID=100907 RepID=A0AAD9C991_DISEL|nr:Dimethylaniline monooxygenase [N-oxide-forming] 5 [Dissostichus eleginoides]